MNRRRRTRPKGNEGSTSTTSQDNSSSLSSPSSLNSPSTAQSAVVSAPTAPRQGRRPNPTTTTSSSRRRNSNDRRAAGMSRKDPEHPIDDKINNTDLSKAATSRKRSKLVMWGVVGVVGIMVAVATSVVVPILVKSRANESDTATPDTTGASDASSPKLQQNKTALYASIGSFELLETVSHDPQAFTQGLGLLNSTHCYESTGLHGQSSIRIVEIATGRVALQRSLSSRYFGEGMTAYHNVDTGRDELVQITWQEKTGFVYDASNLQLLRTFRYNTPTGEGWGITTGPDPSHGASITTHPSFWVSDGSHYLTTWNASFVEVSSVPVTIVLPPSFRTGSGEQVDDVPKRQYLRRLNELEYDPHTDTVLANVWFKDWVVRINATTGEVGTLYDVSNLYPPQDRDPSADVLNGIAVTDVPGVVWVTGKLWPYMYKIRLVDP